MKKAELVYFSLLEEQGRLAALTLGAQGPQRRRKLFLRRVVLSHHCHFHLERCRRAALGSRDLKILAKHARTQRKELMKCVTACTQTK